MRLYIFGSSRLLSLSSRPGPLRAGFLLMLTLVAAPCLLRAQATCDACAAAYSSCMGEVTQAYNECTQTVQDTYNLCEMTASSSFVNCLNDCLATGGGSNCAEACNAWVWGSQQGCQDQFDGTMQGCSDAQDEGEFGCEQGNDDCVYGPPACTDTDG